MKKWSKKELEMLKEMMLLRLPASSMMKDLNRTHDSIAAKIFVINRQAKENLHNYRKAPTVNSRKCLRCQEKFMPEHRFLFLCRDCKRAIARMA